jgi:hypothetical protein
METVSEWLAYNWENERWVLLKEPPPDPQDFLDNGWLVWSAAIRPRIGFTYEAIEIVLWQPLPPAAWRRLFCLMKA